ncbi:MAG TPA: insulinase family protein, partial [Jatrophihabitans sp.]|nr:insulinase family protein [Jatrophihabitans sp.]
MTAQVRVPELAKPVKARAVRTHERVLPSGLRVVAVRQPSVPMIEVRLRIPFFSTKPSHQARSQLLANSMLTGTERYDRIGLAVALGELGADLGLSVDADRLVLSSASLASGLPALLRIFAEVLTAARYPAGEVSGERSRLVERITISRSQAGSMAAEALAGRLAPGHPYGHTLPSVGQIEASTPAQLRALHAAMVRPDRALLVLVGDLSPARAIDSVQAALADWTGSASPATTLPVPAPRRQPMLVVDRPGSVQTSLRFGGAALPREDPRYPAGEVSGERSRLVERITISRSQAGSMA